MDSLISILDIEMGRQMGREGRRSHFLGPQLPRPMKMINGGMNNEARKIELVFLFNNGCLIIEKLMMEAKVRRIIMAKNG
jgi:hypothetical protein